MNRLALALAVIATSSVAHAATDEMVLIHTGRLIAVDDSPITAETTLKVRLWDDDGSAGDEVWSESYTLTPNKDGLYTLALGDTKGSKRALVPSDFSGPRWLSVTIGSVELQPRLRVGTVASAVFAADAGKLGGQTLAQLDTRYVKPGANGSISIAGDVTASGKFLGDGSGLTFTRADVAGAVTSTSLAVSGAATVGGDLTVTGKIKGDTSQLTFSSLQTAGAITAGGVITGDGSGLTNIQTSALSGAFTGSMEGTIAVASSAPACNTGRKGALYLNSGTGAVSFCDGSTWQQIASGASAGAKPAMLGFLPPAVDFDLLAASPTLAVTLRNFGDAPASSLVIAIGTGFEIEKHDCGSSVAANTSCAVYVKQTPITTGVKVTADLTATAGAVSAKSTLTGSGRIATSCAEAKRLRPTAPDGLQTIDFDGPGGAAPVQAYCDMTTENGGWTLVHTKLATDFIPWKATVDLACAKSTTANCASAVPLTLNWTEAMWRFADTAAYYVKWQRTNSNAEHVAMFLQGAAVDTNPNVGSFVKFEGGVFTAPTVVTAMHTYSSSYVSESHGGTDKWLDMWNGVDGSNSYVSTEGANYNGTKCVAGRCRAAAIWLMVR